MREFRTLIFLGALTSAQVISWHAAEARLVASASTTFTNRVEAAAYNEAPQDRSGSEKVQVSATGREESGGSNRLLRRSTANATASGREFALIEASDLVTAFELRTEVSASGGGVRFCIRILGNCTTVAARDTDGIASASANALTDVSLSGLPTGRYSLIVEKSITGEGVLQVDLEDGNGREIEVASEDAPNITVDTGVITRVVVKTGLTSSASNRGTCCKTSQQAIASVKVRVVAVSGVATTQLSRSLDYVPYVVGGVLETKYPQIGYIWINGGAALCTGTLIGKRTVLTAAHCVEGFENQSIEFRLANSISAPAVSRDIYQVESFDYPRDPDVGPAFDALILADDLALLYLDREVLDPENPDQLMVPFDLYTGDPSFSDIRGKALMFVGFGFSDIEPGPVAKLKDKGIKRSVSMTISAESRKTFRNRAPGQNTCNGDSGGPAFLLRQSRAPMIVGVISSGDMRCLDYGNNTRVDAYKGWMNGKVR